MRALFGGDTMLRVTGGITRPNSAPLPATVWDAQEGGNQYTDLLAADQSTPITEVTVTGATTPPFYGPDDVLYMWLDTGDGGRELIRGSFPPGGASDPEIAALVNDPGSSTAAALSGTFAGGARNVGPLAPLWEPPTQPAMTSVSGLTAQGMLDAWWEPLRTAHPDYVTRAQIGMDASGQYPLWRYDFTPANYDRTVVLLGNMHGGEKIGAFNIARLMDYLADGWEASPWLAWMRHNVRIVVVPSVNPWGGTSVDGQRVNANGVDINRNWDYRHAEYVVPSPPYEKGAAPFSEPETQAVRDLLLSLPDLVAVIDCHDTGQTVAGTPIDYYAATPDYPLPRAGFVRDVVNALQQPGESATLHPNEEPISANWCAAQGWRSTVIEYEQRGTALDSENTTRALAWFGNVTMQAAIQSPPSALPKPEPITLEMSFQTGATGIVIPTTMGELEALSTEFQAPGPGVVVFEGELVAGGAAATITVRPSISQADGPIPVHAPSSSNDRYSSLASSSDRQPIPFRIALPVHEDSAPSWAVKLAVYAQTTTATVNVYRYVATATFLPAERTDRYRRLTATGRSGPGAMQQTYP